MYEAAKNGEVDVITAYTTDGRIDAYDLVLLNEPAGALPPYDAFILLSPDAAQDRALMAALQPSSAPWTARPCAAPTPRWISTATGSPKPPTGF